MRIRLRHSEASGNPVKIGDGCATVTGYELPRPLAHQAGKAGVRFQARSQDIGLACARHSCPCKPGICRLCTGANFSVKEKDEASLPRGCAAGFVGCLHSPICRGLKVFVLAAETLAPSLGS